MNSKLQGKIQIGADVTIGDLAFHTIQGSDTLSFCGSDISNRMTPSTGSGSNFFIFIDGNQFSQSTQPACHDGCPNTDTYYADIWDNVCLPTECVCQHGVAFAGSECKTDTEGCKTCQ